MHLVDVVKSGLQLPLSLPVEIIPPHLKAHLVMSGSVVGGVVATAIVTANSHKSPLSRSGSFADALPSMCVYIKFNVERFIYLFVVKCM